MRKLLILTSISLGLAWSGPAHAHITLESPLPRTDAQKQGPCGATGSVRGPAQTFKPGQTITVRWDETTDHVGHYRLAFNLDGEEFPLPNNPNDNFPSVLVDQIPDRQGGGKYSQEITLPEVECDNCTLQLIQVMTTNVPYNSFYFQCSDIVLAESAPGGADAGAGADAGGTADAGDKGDAGDTVDTDKPVDGGCSMGNTRSGGVGFFLLAFACFTIVRRRRQGAF